MSKRGYISRYMLIVKKLKRQPFSTFYEIHDYVKKELFFLKEQDKDLKIGFSKRTLQRDIKEIKNVFNVDIEYSNSQKGYYISQSEYENMNFQRMLEAFDLFNSLNQIQDIAPFIYLENSRPQGTDNMYVLLHAIKNKLQIKFTYQKFEEDELSDRIVEPYGLKEFRNRWYVLAKDYKGHRIKSFALDRLSNLEISKLSFLIPENFNFEQSYKNCFGIIGPNDEKPHEIILKFTPFQGKYIKALPLHKTQEIITDNQKELIIKLELFLTYDFIMELLSFGDQVKVIKPQHLINQIQLILKTALKQY